LEAQCFLLSLCRCCIWRIKTACEGRLEYLHRSPASRKRRRKGNPVPRGLAFQVGRVSNETVNYGLSSAGLGSKRDCSGQNVLMSSR
jgi:hypothetical protein